MAGEVIAVFAVLLFSISNAMIRKVETIASPVQINAVRTSIGAITFVIIAGAMLFLDEAFTLSKEIWLYLLISVIFAQVLGDTLYLKAQELLGTTKALAISMTFPLITFLFSVIILKDTIHYFFYISAVLIIGGVLLIAKSQAQDLSEKVTVNNEMEQKVEVEQGRMKKFFSSVWFSVLIGLLASISWALGIVYTKKALDLISTALNQEAASSLIGNAVRFPIAALILVLFAWRLPKPAKVKEWDRKSWIWLLIASLIGTSAAAFLYAEGTRVAGAPLMSLIAAASPLFALPFTWFLNKEKINIVGFLGVILTIGGVVLILLKDLII